MSIVEKMECAILVSLLRSGVTADVQEMLCQGDGRGTIAPLVLRRALAHALTATGLTETQLNGLANGTMVAVPVEPTGAIGAMSDEGFTYFVDSTHLAAEEFWAAMLRGAKEGEMTDETCATCRFWSPEDWDGEGGDSGLCHFLSSEFVNTLFNDTCCEHQPRNARSKGADMTPFTPERVAQLREILAKATPGGWKSAVDTWSTEALKRFVMSAFDAVADNVSIENSEAIVAAVNTFPEALNEIERLNAERDEINSTLRKCWPELADPIVRINELSAELSRVKAERDEAAGLLANYERMLSAKKQDFIGFLGGASLNEKTRSFLSRMEGK